MRWRVFLEPAKRDVDSYVAVFIDRAKRKGKESVDINLKVADCTQSVGLNFGYGEGDWQKSREEASAKLAKLEKALALIRAEIDRG